MCVTKKLNNIIFLTEEKELLVRNVYSVFLTSSSFCFAMKGDTILCSVEDIVTECIK